MPEPRRQVIRRHARNLHYPDPERATFPKLQEHIKSFPDVGWVDKDAAMDQLIADLDGARPLF